MIFRRRGLYLLKNWQTCKSMLVTLSSHKVIHNELMLMTILINIADINAEMNMNANDVVALLLLVFFTHYCL